jgi:hypothetical protein
MLGSLVFLSHGIQLSLFLLLVGLLLVFMKLTTVDAKIKNIEDNLTMYVTNEDYMETFNNMWEEKKTGGSTAPYFDN